MVLLAEDPQTSGAFGDEPVKIGLSSSANDGWPVDGPFRRREQPGEARETLGEDMQSTRRKP